jgi:F-type H+-transporting ATPase subunit gamma
LRAAEQHARERAGRETAFFAVGKIGAAFLKRRGYRIAETLTDVGYRFTPETLVPLVDKLKTAFLSGEYDRIGILSMSLAKGGVSRPVHEPFLDLSFFLEGKRTKGPELDYLFEPDRKAVLEALVTLYVKQRFYMALLGSVMAEYNARMVAMKLATDNAKDLIKELTLERNKVRQAMITKEISEIIGGVNALN